MNEVGQTTIREAGREDAPTLFRLMIAAFAEYEGVLDPLSGAHHETFITVVRKLSAGGAALALVDGEPAGFAFYQPDGDLLYFGRLSVLPRFPNRVLRGARTVRLEFGARQGGARRHC